MTVSHELDSEIAVALLAAGDKSNTELKDLEEIVFKVHSLLQEMSEMERTLRHRSRFASQDDPRDR
jgi:hypothetical protein